MLQILEEHDHDVMFNPYKDPCPKCGEVMLVGDFVCWGICYSCYKVYVNEASDQPQQ